MTQPLWTNRAVPKHIAGVVVALTVVACRPSDSVATAAAPGSLSAEKQPAVEPPSETAMSPPSTAPTPSDTPPVDLRNRLGEETSPYLLQHQHNPVHWFPWGPEAFAAARALDRPIFLSIGYSTCYWCHVMERESFENEAIAAIMNEHFICIKVDREERPDVDDIYMMAVQMLTGHGGWPMSVFIEPEGLRPFIGGTYFPPEDGLGRPGFPSVLRQVADFWANRRPDILQQSQAVADAIVQRLATPGPVAAVGQAEVDLALAELMSTYDTTDGGFVGAPQRAPKFPITSTLDFLIGAGWEREDVRRAVLYTLDRMAMGGMYDQVGGGFHRYSTDAMWLVPHFEKMLYDNGQLASTYAAAYDRTGDPFYAEVIRETLDYVLREMTGPSGGFYSAQDAEVNHREGQNYLWTPEGVAAALAEAGLDQADVEFAGTVYGFDRGTNFQDPHHRDDPPSNVVFLVDRPDALAEKMGLEQEVFDVRLRAINQAMLTVRDRRDQPITDDKILTGWNGLMIAGLADGGRVLDEPRYTQAAARAATYILDRLRRDDGALLRTARADMAKIDAFLEDYAFMIQGLVALYRATDDQRFVDAAVELAAIAKDRFWDERSGGYFDTLADQSDLFVRIKSTYDGATPCGNSVMVNNLVDLAELTGDQAYRDEAAATLRSMSDVLQGRPTAATLAMLGLHALRDDPAFASASEAPAAPATAPGPPVSGEIAFLAQPDRVELAGEAPGRFDITITLADGYHVNAHKPGIDFLIPLSVTLVDGAGLDLNVAYPPGELYLGPEGQMNVHHKTVKLPVTITRNGPVTGTPRIMLTYQVCTDQMCLAPETKRVAVEIAVKE